MWLSGSESSEMPIWYQEHTLKHTPLPPGLCPASRDADVASDPNQLCFVFFWNSVFFYVFFVLIYWSIVDLQCCVNFCCREKRVSCCLVARSYTCVCIYIHFSIMVYHRILNMVPYAVVGPCCGSILYNSLPLLVPNSQSFLPPWQPQDLASVSMSLFLFYR